MKRYIKTALFAAVAGMSLTSCSDFLDVDPHDKINDEAVWSSVGYAKSYLNNCYTWIEGDNQYGVPWCSYTDEFYHRTGYATEVYTLGNVSCDNYNVGYTDGKGDTWNFYYKAINAVNNLLEHLPSVTMSSASEEEEKEQIEGQAYFLRAYYYHILYSLYGRVPLMYQTVDLDSEWTQTRAPMDEVADSIVADCDRAAALLPTVYEDDDDFGRATKGAALAVKARTLLYKASPLFDEESNGNSSARWQEASDAQKAIIDLGVYSLPSVNDYEEYADLFTSNAKDNPEAIFMKLYESNTDFDEPFSQSYPMSSPPGYYNGYYGWGVWLPSYNGANLYENADGSKFELEDVQNYSIQLPSVNTETNEIEYSPATIKATKTNPYVAADGSTTKREMRFYANILFDGAMWGYEGEERAVQIFEPGEKDVTPGEQSPSATSGEYWNATKTGYYMRKFMNKHYDVENSLYSDDTPWIFFRLSEFYLNYAECQIELGNNSEALKYINLIRNRVHLPDATGKDIRADYEYERQVELMFEGQRFFDLRRWKKMDEAYSGDNLPTAMKVYKLADGTLLYCHDTTVLQQRSFRDAMYWMPVPRTELNKCPNIDAKPYE